MSSSLPLLHPLLPLLMSPRSLWYKYAVYFIAVLVKVIIKHVQTYKFMNMKLYISMFII